MKEQDSKFKNPLANKHASDFPPFDPDILSFYKAFATGCHMLYN